MLYAYILITPSTTAMQGQMNDINNKLDLFIQQLTHVREENSASHTMYHSLHARTCKQKKEDSIFDYILPLKDMEQLTAFESSLNDSDIFRQLVRSHLLK